MSRLSRIRIFLPPLSGAGYLEQSAWNHHAPFAFWLDGGPIGRAASSSWVRTADTVFHILPGGRGAWVILSSCYAVDTWKGDEHAEFDGEEVYQRARDYNESLDHAAFSRLVRSSFNEAVDHFPDASIDLLHIDGRHFYEDVKHDFQTWQPKLSERAVVLFHDTNVRERNFGVFRLWEELQTEFPSFEFLHGHGLGVLGYGANLPEDSAAFLAASKHPNVATEVRQAYARLGAALKADFEARKTQSQLTATLSMQKAQVGALEAKLEGESRR